MKIDTNKIIASSLFNGFFNSSAVTFSASVASQNIAAGGYVGPIQASTAMNNANGISQIQIQYSGVDSFWRLLPGIVVYDVPSAAAPSYQIETYSYFSGGTLHVDTIISNQTGGTITIPALTINVRAFIFNAPF